MEISKVTYQERYSGMETHELIQLHTNGSLNEIAMEAITEELSRRGLEKEKLEEKIQEEKENEITRELDDAVKKIKGATTGLFVIAALQIIITLGFQAWLGVAFGILMVILTIIVRFKKTSSAAIALLVIGGISIITNFLGPMITGVKFGNSILSIVVFWLAYRCYKGTHVLQQDKYHNADISRSTENKLII